MKKVLIVFGTRPEAIKMCPLVLKFKQADFLETKVCITGQHKEILQQTLDFFQVDADFNFSIMRENQSLAYITSSILESMNELISNEHFDIMLVHGDTSTTFACSLAAFYNHIPVGHVEAGLRTYNLNSPYPEEFNRQAVSILSQLNFAPTEMSRDNLLNEGKLASSVFVTGNTAIDAIQYTVQANYHHDVLDWAQDSKLILLTAHRRENWGEAHLRIFKAVLNILDSHPEIKVIYPVHPNPVVSNLAHSILGSHPRLKLIDPLDVFDFHNFIKQSFLILTDSGGIQEEAPAMDKPVLVLRDTTERPEGIAAGTLKLVGTDIEKITASIELLLNDPCEYDKMCCAINPYGDGRACEKIVSIVSNYLGGL